MAQRCLIIGTSQEARRVIDLVHRHPHAGMKILGIILVGTDREHVGKFVEDYPVLGTLESLDKFVDLYGIDRLILAASLDFEPVLLQRLRQFRYRGLALVDFVTLYEELAQEIPIDYINDEWLFMASMNNSRFHIRRLKRLVDVVVSLIGLILTAPVIAVTAVLVKLTSPGPVFYRQERLGRDSVPFYVVKFRTMRADAESQSGPVWATEDDPRITWIGKYLRKFRIDEIPQLWNVLRGEMSLVGPRPERAVFVKKLSEKIPFYSERLLVAPGVTGWAQVMHPYAASIEESRRKLQYDLFYIKHMSFLLDLFIMMKTLKTVLFGRERAKPEPKPAATPPEEIRTEMLFFRPAGQAGTAKPSAKKSAG
jgi:exopolysaccharide biosynthesis polyprenyl glycosylphosphotransferase